MMFSRVTSFKWMFQTALVGFPSLGLLLRHRKQREIASKKVNWLSPAVMIIVFSLVNRALFTSSFFIQFLLVLKKLEERVMWKLQIAGLDRYTCFLVPFNWPMDRNNCEVTAEKSKYLECVEHQWLYSRNVRCLYLHSM